MAYYRFLRAADTFSCRARSRCRTSGLALAALLFATSLWAQDAQSTTAKDKDKERVEDGYTVRQTIDFGGRIVDSSGSSAMYDTLVNLQSGPRILSQTLDLHATPDSKHLFFDTLTAANSGYGGDPDDVTTLRISKGKLYRFQGLFRRDREYFDYNLLDNTLIPPGVVSNGYTFPQQLSSPHLFNTVRRMTDVGLTLFPISKLSFRTNYSQNINQGPSFSSQHNGAEALYLQNWRNSTDTWIGAVDWKPISKTMLTFEESVVHYKGDTNWQLTGLNMQLSDGTPVTLGFDHVTVPVCADGNPAVLNSATTPPTANATCNGYLQYYRYAPTRTLSPTEEFRFQSSTIKNVEMNGRLRYTGANMNLPNYVEYFNGLDNMDKRAFTTTGYGNGKRINVSADYGFVWEISRRFSLSEQFDFWDFREPATSNLAEVDQLDSNGVSMLAPPGPPQPPSVTFAQTFMGMKTETNTTTLGWEPSSKVNVSLGYRYQKRDIRWVMPLSTDALPNGTAYTFPISENGGILSVTFQPTRQWRINGKVEASYADKAYTQISPRALQRYRIQTRYKPREWATITGSFNDLERRDNIYLVNHLDHNRNFTLGAVLMPNPRYGLDLSYGYSDVFTRTTLCFAATPPPIGPGAGAAPPDCGTNTNLGTGYYDAPTQYGSFGITLTPVKKLRLGAGYRMSAVNGTTEFLNVLQVAGSLQSQYQTPYANVAWTVHPGWVWKANWNHYEYEEGGPVGPTSPRDFKSEVLTLAMHYEF
jgi:hypothetical protein